MGLDRARGRGRGLEVAEPPLSVLSAANETVDRGYYAPTTLSAVDAELATANIKNGITIFGFAGSADVRDISDATAIEAEVLSLETFYAVSGGIRTGTMPIVALDPDLNEYPEGYHAGEASLTAVDADLAAGNIKNGVVIFGVTGTLSATLADDVSDTGCDPTDAFTIYSSYYNWTTPISIDAGADIDIVSVTQNYAAVSRAVAVAINVGASGFNCKPRIYMDGAEVAEGVAVGAPTREILIGSRALSGVKICKLSIHNYEASAKDYYAGSLAPSSQQLSCIGVGSIKVT